MRKNTRHIEDASKLKKYFTGDYKKIHNIADKARHLQE